MRAKLKEFESLPNLLKTAKRSTVKQIVPKIFEGIGGWHSPTPSLIVLWESAKVFQEDQAEIIEITSASYNGELAVEDYIEKYGQNPSDFFDSLLAIENLAHCFCLHEQIQEVPFFFLKKDWVEAVRTSNRDHDFSWNACFPSQCGFFFFPKGIFIAPSYEIISLSWIKGEHESRPETKGKLRYEVIDHEAQQVSFFVLNVPSKIMKVNFDSQLVDALQWADENEGNLFAEAIKKNTQSDPQLFEAKKAMERQNGILSLFANICLAMLARPEFVEPGRKVKMHKASGREIWTPNIIGRKYTIKREHQGGSHASPRLHWRRGHFRTQRFGPALSESKVIWIEPLLVAGQAEKERAA